jgi:formylglycine-generating enzyme required for sulfatase activity
MLPDEYRWIADHFEPDSDPSSLLAIARELEDAGNLEGAATAYDRAFGVNPTDPEVVETRRLVLDRLAVIEYGIVFRYVPGGSFLMGYDQGEPDERPWHPVWLQPFWIAETPMSWAAYCRLLDWEPPPAGFPREAAAQAEGFDEARFHLYNANKIRLQYCEDRTTRAIDWHAHSLGQWESGGQTHTAQELFGSPPRHDPQAPWQYDTKPMVAVPWEQAVALGEHLSTSAVRYTLPTEAQWEKAARGGRVGAQFAWGNEPPSSERCDFDRFSEFSILPMRTFPPNGYGLYAVCGGVWEWTQDWYVRDRYPRSQHPDPQGPERGEEKVVRGGSWADCPEVLRVSYRMSRGPRQGGTPNIGFRLSRARTSLLERS